MSLIKKDTSKWKWRPKRWWIFLIVFWFFSTSGARIFGIEPKTDDALTFMMLMTFLVVFAAAITDRKFYKSDKKYAMSKRIGSAILTWILFSMSYEFAKFLVSIVLGTLLSAILTSLIFAVLAIRQSIYFVEPLNEKKITGEHNEEKEVSTSMS